VAASTKFGCSLPPYTCIQKKLHFVGGDSMVRGSIRSFPTWRRA
jgi:hypothetical protein